MGRPADRRWTGHFGGGFEALAPSLGGANGAPPRSNPGVRRVKTHVAGPSRPRLGLQAPDAAFPGGGPRADRRSDASTSSVAGDQATARSSSPPRTSGTPPQTPERPFNSSAHPTCRDEPRGRRVSRTVAMGGTATRRGAGRTNRCHRCRGASAPPTPPVRRGRRYQGSQAFHQLQRRERPRRRPARPSTLQLQPDQPVIEHLGPGTSPTQAEARTAPAHRSRPDRAPRAPVLGASLAHSAADAPFAP